jgi:hypothetical protein
MARLFPTLDPSTIDNPGERFVAQALVEHLPSRAEVFHSFTWPSRNRQGTLTEGECDFVLLDPERGLLFVEVKGGSLVFDGREWLRAVGGERRSLNNDPFSQAQRAMHDVVDLVKRRFPGTGDLPFTYGFAVAFPDARVSGTLPPSIQPELILDAAKLKDLQDAIGRVFASFTRSSHRALTEREMESVREALYPKYQLLPVVWRKVEDQEERLRRLTADQQRILDLLANQPRAAIRGVAESGKTILALAKAQSLARAGVRTVLRCYNRPLKDWLQGGVKGTFLFSGEGRSLGLGPSGPPGWASPGRPRKSGISSVRVQAPQGLAGTGNPPGLGRGTPRPLAIAPSQKSRNFYSMRCLSGSCTTASIASPIPQWISHCSTPTPGPAPIFRGRRDAELNKHIYRRVPVLIREDQAP